MGATRTTGETVTERLKRTPATVRPTVLAARRAVRTVAPTAREITYTGDRPRSKVAMWKLVRYALPDTDRYAVAIGTFADHASLFFPRGVELDDGSGLLEGSGKTFRFITLRTPADASRAAVTRVLRKAFRL